MIQDSPARMYNFAHTLCPPSSWLHGCYYAEFSQKVKVVLGLTEWGMCTRTVSCSSYTVALACWNNAIAISPDHNIIIIDALTGGQTAILSGHTEKVQSLAFSLDGALLVSGGADKNVKLWDVQTGGIIKTLCGHANWVRSVSISADNTMIASADNTTIASGSTHSTIRLWNIKTGNCHVIKEYAGAVTFSPTNPQLLLYSSSGVVKQWNTDGHEIDSSVTGSHIAFSPDGAHFASCGGSIVTIRNTNSRTVMVEFNIANEIQCCCFSPDGKFIAVATRYIIHLWDITSPSPHLIQTLMGHAAYIYSLVFSSPLTLISTSDDKTIKFWKIGVSSGGPVTPESEPIPLISAPIRSVSLQAKKGLAFSIDSEGVVKTWDILTGCYKESHRTQAQNIAHGDMQLIGDRLIIVWNEDDTIHVWDTEKGRLQTIEVTWSVTRGLRIARDGTRVLWVGSDSIQAWSIWTGESAGKERLEWNNRYCFDPLQMDGSKVLVQSRESSAQGWDFGVPGSAPIQLPEMSSVRPHLDLVDVRRWSWTSPVKIMNSATGQDVFQLYGKYADPSAIQWDGQYLIAGYASGEVLILDFSHVLV